MGHFIALICDVASNICGLVLPLSRRRFRAMTRDVIYSNRKLVSMLGISPGYGVSTGLKRAINFYRSDEFISLGKQSNWTINIEVSCLQKQVFLAGSLLFFWFLGHDRYRFFLCWRNFLGFWGDVDIMKHHKFYQALKYMTMMEVWLI